MIPLGLRWPMEIYTVGSLLGFRKFKTAQAQDLHFIVLHIALRGIISASLVAVFVIFAICFQGRFPFQYTNINL